jgi:general secretion pathway protein A
MYEQHFGFTRRPFALTPDPAFLYMSRQHAMAMTMLEYGLESQAAFALLTGDIGSGKTTLLRRLLRSLDDRIAVGLISNTHGRFASIHRWVISALGIAAASDSEVGIYEALQDFCVKQYAKGGRTLLVVDEAQNLSIDVLEELRLLSNINSEADLVLQVLLVGQPELRTILERPELAQFAQRISVDFHLQPLDRAETHAYVAHRLAVAGSAAEIFTSQSIDLAYFRTNGIPRLLNQLCDYALVYAYAEGRKRIDAELIAQVIRERKSAQSAIVPAGAESNVTPLGLPDRGMV